MAHFKSICCYYPLNPQVLLYDIHDSPFDDRTLNILRSHQIQSFILKAGNSVHEHLNNNGQNLKLKNFNGNERMNSISKHVTIKFTMAHMNTILV